MFIPTQEILDFAAFGISWAAMTGLVEGLFKPLVTKLTRQAIDKVAPTFYALVDEECRALARKGGGGKQLQARVRERLELLTGQEWSDETLAPLWQGADLRAFLDRFAGEPLDVKEPAALPSSTSCQMGDPITGITDSGTGEPH